MSPRPPGWWELAEALFPNSRCMTADEAIEVERIHRAQVRPLSRPLKHLDGTEKPYA